MPKRFTDSEKWKDRWFRSLNPPEKLAWLYLLDNCDQAGVIHLDEELADFQIGEPVDWTAFIQNCGCDRLARVGCKLWVVRFVQFQYGDKLSRDCKAHNPVFRSIEKHSLSIPFPKGIERDQVIVKVKDKERDKAKSVAPEGIEDSVWQSWLAARKAKRLCAPTSTVMDRITREATKAGISMAEAIKLAAEKSWGSFEASWMPAQQSETLNDQPVQRTPPETKRGDYVRKPKPGRAES